MSETQAQFEPGDAAYRVAMIAAKLVATGADVVISTGEYTTALPGFKSQIPCQELTADLIHAAIRDLSFGAEIPIGKTLSRQGVMDGQRARITLCPHNNVLGRPGPCIQYHWMPNKIHMDKGF